MSDFVIIGGLPLVSHKGSSLVVESAEIVRATEKPKSRYSQSPQWTSMNGSNQFMLQLSSAPLHSPRPICTHPRPYIWRQQTATRWRTQTLDAYGREHLEPKSIGSQTATLAADQSRRRQIQAITATAHRCCALPHEGLSLSTTPPPFSLVFYHADFDKESPARWLSPAALQVARSSGAKSKQWHRCSKLILMDLKHLISTFI